MSRWVTVIIVIILVKLVIGCWSNSQKAETQPAMNLEIWFLPRAEDPSRAEPWKAKMKLGTSVTTIEEKEAEGFYREVKESLYRLMSVQGRFPDRIDLIIHSHPSPGEAVIQRVREALDSRYVKTTSIQK